MLRDVTDPGSAFWRKVARWAASHGPELWLRVAPGAVGLIAVPLMPAAREMMRSNLHTLRGPRGRVRDTIDVSRTFITYAQCLAEVLAHGTKNGRAAEATIDGGGYLDDVFGRAGGTPAAATAKSDHPGAVLVTAHTAGWETVGPMLEKRFGTKVTLVMHKEPNAEARAVHDEARRATGVNVVHIGDDPLDALPLLRHVRSGGIAAMQLDRQVGRLRDVTLFGQPGKLPEGPLHLAALSGAPLVAVFCARVGFRRYVVKAAPPIRLPRRPTEAQLQQAAQSLADAMSEFLVAHPTQWFHFGEASAFRARAQGVGGDAG